MDTSPKSAIDEGGAGRGTRRKLPPRGIARPERTSGRDQRAHWNPATLVTPTVRAPVVLLKSERQR
jgi:hypothetical protein